MDTSEGTWTIEAQGVARARTVTGVLWISDDESIQRDFQIEGIVTLGRSLRVGTELMRAGSFAFIVEFKDPTLSPKNKRFIGVKFGSEGSVVWLGLEDVVGGSEDDELQDFFEEFEDQIPRPRYFVH